MKLEVGMYVRIQWGNGEQTISKCTNKVDMGDTQYSNNDFYIHTDKKGEVIYKSMIVKASHNILELIEPMDLMFIDISPDDCGGIVVPRIAETINELEQWKERISNKNCILKYIVTREQIESARYKVGE